MSTDNSYIHDLIPKSLKLNIKEEFEIYKPHKTNLTEIINDQTNFQANIIFASTLHINPRQ